MASSSRARRSRSPLSGAKSVPLTRTSPSVGMSVRVTQRSSVVLPLPLPPSTITSSPALTAMLNRESASFPFG